MQTTVETPATRWLFRPFSPLRERRPKSQNHPFTRFWHSPRVRSARHLFSARRWYGLLTAEERRLPDFLIAGAQKSGTTSLYAYLSEHPQVAAPMTKELSFFDNHFDRGLHWYRSHFPLLEAHLPDVYPRLPSLSGESTAYYLCHPHAARRIADTLPRVKIILLLRNPVDRAFSHYQLNLRRGKERLSFEAAIAAEATRLSGERNRMLRCQHYHSFAHEKYSYLARGRYAEQITIWQEHFSPRQLLVIESGEFFRSTGPVFDRVLDFLDLPRWRPAKFGNRFPGNYLDSMDPATRDRLIDYFAPHNERLYALLSRRFDWDHAGELTCAAA